MSSPLLALLPVVCPASGLARETRIEAGIDHPQAGGYARIMLPAHNRGVHMSMTWLDAVEDPRIAACIGIGMGATAGDYETGARMDRFVEIWKKPAGCVNLLFPEGGHKRLTSGTTLHGPYNTSGVLDTCQDTPGDIPPPLIKKSPGRG